MRKYITAITIACFLSPALYAADTLTENSIIGLYIAYYNRSPDLNGFDFWTKAATSQGNNEVLKSISKGFSAAPEFKIEYPATLSNQEFITKIYQNVLNREPDTDGMNFWLSILETGLSKSDFIVEYINAVLNENPTEEEAINAKEMFKNKVEVSRFFMDTLKDASNGSAGSEAYKRSIEVLAAVTNNIATVTSAKNKISEYCNNSQINCTENLSGDKENFNLILKDNTSSTSCNYKSIKWDIDGNLTLVLKNFDTCFK